MSGDAAVALAEAEAKLTAWLAAGEEKTRAAEAAAAGLAEHEARIGTDLLDDPGGLDAATDDLLRLRAEQEVAHRAAAAAAEQVDQARRQVLSARAEGLRRRAEVLREVAAARRARTDQLLAELREHERVAYGIDMLRSDQGSVWQPRSFTDLVVAEAAVLDKRAAGLAALAASGTAEQVAQAVDRAEPDLRPVEVDALTGAADASAAV